MSEIDWYGTGGYFFPKPGTVKVAACGVCNAQMRVRRNVLGPTSWAEAMARKKHMHDHFSCSSLTESWHQRIYKLKMDVYYYEINHRDPIGLEKMKQAVKKEILKLLKDHTAR